MVKVCARQLETPLGVLHVAASTAGLCRICFPKSFLGGWLPWFERHFSGRPRQASMPLLERALEQLQDYFGGRLQRFDLSLDLKGTLFQRRVWRQLLAIPFGATLSYGEVARRIGRPGAARAVGSAVGQNPVPIVIPCHRVIGHDGSLVGFGGGLPVKERLLAMEGVQTGGKRGGRRRSVRRHPFSRQREGEMHGR